MPANFTPNKIYERFMPLRSRVLCIALVCGASCTSIRSGQIPEDINNTVVKLDKKVIADLTKPEKENAIGYQAGVSGRILKAINIVSEEISLNHNERCQIYSFDRYIYLYTDEGSKIMIRTVPRIVPIEKSSANERAPKSKGEIGIRKLYPKFPENAVALEGCEIEFSVDLNEGRVLNAVVVR